MDGSSERFRSTSGRVIGGLGLLVAAYVVGDGLVRPGSGVSVAVTTGALFCGVVLWAAMMRPCVVLTESALTLRNMLTSVTIPLAAVEEVAVRQVLAVRAGKRYVSSAIGRSRRQISHDARDMIQQAARPIEDQQHSYGLFIEERIRSRAEDARARLGITLYSDEQEALAAQVARRPAWIEIGLLAVTGVATALLVAF